MYIFEYLRPGWMKKCYINLNPVFTTIKLKVFVKKHTDINTYITIKTSKHSVALPTITTSRGAMLEIFDMLIAHVDTSKYVVV